MHLYIKSILKSSKLYAITNKELRIKLFPFINKSEPNLL